jgi:hypothetical protein
VSSAIPSVRVLCPDCSVVRVPATEVTLRNCVDDGRWDYWFLCPGCERLSAGVSTTWLAVEAFAAGSALEVWHLPAELSEPHDGPPLSLVDLVELHLALTEPDWFDALLQAIDDAADGSYEPP